VNPSDQEKLTPGIAIQLEDDDIAENLDSYERPVLFGVLRKILWQEFDYHIFECDTHFFSRTHCPDIIHDGS
jgi:hypothetical protein